MPARQTAQWRAGQRDAGVGVGAVADEVAEAPELLRAVGLGGLDHRLEGVPVAVDVGDDGDPHGGVASIRCRRGSRLPLAVVAALVVAEAAVLLLRPRDRVPTGSR